MASPANLRKAGADGFDLIDKQYGRFSRPIATGGSGTQQGQGHGQVPKREVPLTVNNNDAAAQSGGKKIGDNSKPKPKPVIRNWGRTGLIGRQVASTNAATT